MSARYGPTHGVKPTPNASPMRNDRGNPVVLPSRRRSSSRIRKGIVIRPTMCIPRTMSRIPPIRWSQYTRSPASAPTSAIATHRSVNTTLKPRTNASACATVRVRCVPASAASPAMFTRNAGTSGSTHGERNERMPAPNAITTFTRQAYLRAKSMRRCAVFCLVLAALTASCAAAPSQPALTSAPTSAATTAAAAATATVTPTLTAKPTATAAVAVIEMGDNFFGPSQLTVKVGTTVTWKVVGQSTHDLAAKDGSFVNRTMSFGQTFLFTFTEAGHYGYVCMQHEGDGMIGEVTVID